MKHRFVPPDDFFCSIPGCFREPHHEGDCADIDGDSLDGPFPWWLVGGMAAGILLAAVVIAVLVRLRY